MFNESQQLHSVLRDASVRAAADSRVRLGLLERVDKAIDALVLGQETAKEGLRIFRDFVSEYAASQPGVEIGPIDPEDELRETFETAESDVKAFISGFEIKWERISRNPELPKDQAEDIGSEVERTIFLFKQLHDAIVEARWLIMEHDANVDEASGTMPT